LILPALENKQKNANTLTGTRSDEIFVAGAGNDILTGNGGMDVFNAGLGNDGIIIKVVEMRIVRKLSVMYSRSEVFSR
jgi:Ca2+-binding RTX toxin-like protein